MTILLSDEPSAVRGCQTPRIRHVPEYVSSSGPEAIECAERAGLFLDPWQSADLTDALGERPDGKWASFEVGVDVARQNGKGGLLEARELAGLFVFEEKLLIHSAHEQATASEHFRRILNLIEGVPEFDQRVLKVVRGKGSEAIELRKGQRIFFKTRTGGGGRGLTGDFVALDEAMILPIAVTGALVPTMAARSMIGNPQLWYAGSSVDKERHEHGIVFARVRARGIVGAKRLMYVEYSADVRVWREAHGLPYNPEVSDLDQVTPELLADLEMWAQANPGMGIRISVEHIADEHGGALGPREFAVERLGIWDPPDISEELGRVIGREAWAGCAEHDPANRITTPLTFSIDSNVDGTWGSIGVAGGRADGLTQGAVAHHLRSTDWIVDACVVLKRSHSKARFVIDKRGPASHLIPALKKAGVRLIEASTEDYGDACADFVALVVDGKFKYPEPQPELDEALANARKATLGDRWKWSRKDSASADISPLVAVTLAAWGHHQKPPRPRVINPYDYV